MQAVVKLPLKRPLELRMVEIARMKFKVIRVNREGGILEIDDDFDAFTFFASVEVEERVLVEAELRKNAV